MEIVEKYSGFPSNLDSIVVRTCHSGMLCVTYGLMLCLKMILGSVRGPQTVLDNG